MVASSSVEVEVGPRRLTLTNLDKLMYPACGYTKAQVIDYYVRIAAVMVPHIAGRCMTMKRFPDGVDGESFFNKRCPDWRPDWIEAAKGPGESAGDIHYCRIDETASLVWAANLASLELHAPMATAEDILSPTMVVYDLDPGEGTSIVECAQVAVELVDVLSAVSLKGWPKTSGSKGMQVYVPLNVAHTHEHASSFARASGQLLERALPDRVTTVMSKARRTNKVFIDWSQNSFHKTTIAPYSLRTKAEPTVSTPVTWDEVDDCASGAVLEFGPDDVLARVEEHGDIFEPTLTLEQELPGG